MVVVVLLGLVALAALQPRPALELSASNVDQGGTVTARFSGFKAGQSVDITVEPSGTRLATIRADTQGRLAYNFNVPRGFATGPHQLKGCAAAQCVQAPFTVALKA